jgi:hypothetical protein
MPSLNLRKHTKQHTKQHPPQLLLKWLQYLLEKVWEYVPTYLPTYLPTYSITPPISPEQTKSCKGGFWSFLLDGCRDCTFLVGFLFEWRNQIWSSRIFLWVELTFTNFYFAFDSIFFFFFFFCDIYCIF